MLIARNWAYFRAWALFRVGLFTEFYGILFFNNFGQRRDLPKIKHDLIFALVFDILEFVQDDI